MIVLDTFTIPFGIGYKKECPGHPRRRTTRARYLSEAVRLEDELHAELHDARIPGSIDKAVAVITIP